MRVRLRRLKGAFGVGSAERSAPLDPDQPGPPNQQLSGLSIRMPCQPTQRMNQKPEIITSHAQELQSLDEALHMSAHIRPRRLPEKPGRTRDGEIHAICADRIAIPLSPVHEPDFHRDHPAVLGPECAQ